MTSEKQLEANRKNALRSTGPKTNEGKEKSRFNSLRHGLRTEVVDVLPHESQQEFSARLEAWFEDQQPTTEAEDHLVRQAAILSWKIDRANRYEVVSLTARVNEAIETLTPETYQAMEAATLASFDPSSEGERIRRYQFSLQRALHRTLEMLAKLRAQNSKPAGARMKPDALVAQAAVLAEARAEDSKHPQNTTTEPSFEEILQETNPKNATTEPISTGTTQVLFGDDPKRTPAPNPKIQLPESKSVYWLDVSCFKS